MNTEKVVMYIDNGEPRVWCFVDKPEDFKNAVTYSKNSFQEIIQRWYDRGVIDSPTEAAFLPAYKNKIGVGYCKEWETMRMIPYVEYEAIERERMLQPAKRITEERYNDMLECLPPLRWDISLKRFFMSEFITGSYTDMYFKSGGEYYTQVVDYTDRTTWKPRLLNGVKYGLKQHGELVTEISGVNIWSRTTTGQLIAKDLK